MPGLPRGPHPCGPAAVIAATGTGSVHERFSILASYARKSVVALFAGTAITVAAAAPASAANNQNQSGLVNVAVGDVTVLQDVNVGVAAQVAAAICGVKVGPVAVLGTTLDPSGATTTVCTTSQGPVTLQQA